MITLFVLFVLLIGFALAASLWGYDSRESMQSAEWTKRVQRNGSSDF